jgi:1-aminocyclopropane-1-carboxylate deaminase/D-cysteine desulfhydrase-like pyridoxal-dependent ACC family enzyme
VASPISLGTWPTPLEKAPRLAATLGLDELWIKRDDLSGLGAGGNKVRKLQYTCAEALAAGATTLITTGAPQSNHARLTAAAAARLGLRAVLVLGGSPTEPDRGNLLLDSLAGAEIVWAGPTPLDQCAEVTAAELRGWGARPYIIPFGGSSPASVQGYVDCAREIEQQLGEFDRVVVAVGSGGTMAGLVTALGPERVLGVDTGAVADPHAAVAALTKDGSAPDLQIDRRQIGAGYGAFTDRALDAIKLAARTEGLFLDPIYTGRAMASLVAGSVPRRGRTVFVHTGGLPALFAG